MVEIADRRPPAWVMIGRVRQRGQGFRCRAAEGAFPVRRPCQSRSDPTRLPFGLTENHHLDLGAFDSWLSVPHPAEFWIDYGFGNTVCKLIKAYWDLDRASFSTTRQSALGLIASWPSWCGLACQRLGRSSRLWLVTSGEVHYWVDSEHVSISAAFALRRGSRTDGENI